MEYLRAFVCHKYKKFRDESNRIIDNNQKQIILNKLRIGPRLILNNQPRKNKHNFCMIKFSTRF